VVESGPRYERPEENKAAKRIKALKHKALVEPAAGQDENVAVAAHTGFLADAIAHHTKLKKQRHSDDSRLEVHKMAIVTFN